MKRGKKWAKLMANLLEEGQNTIQELDGNVVCKFKNFVAQEY